MSKERSRQYKESIDRALATPRLQEALHRFGDAYVLARENAFSGIDFEALRTEIAALKDEVRENHGRYLAEFIRNAEAAGAKVFFARTAEEANAYIADLARERRVKLAVKSKSMASEEIHLNQALEKAGVKALETDLGEWIIQLAGQRPSHMVMPAIHMFKEEVAELFGKVTGREEPAEIPHLVQVAREQLRQGYLDADMGISGANVAVAETGGIALITNEGNARLATTLPGIHVALVGIEKLVPTLEDADRIIQALPRNATGQLLTSYVSWIRGAVPCADGGKELHIVLLDNGRSALAGDPHCRDALRCIKCGACANVCPVYQSVGGHVFGHIYISAIGIILTAFFHGLHQAADLVSACIGCRSCVTVCPSKIDLENIILHLREVVGRQEGIGAGKSLVFRRVMRNRKLFHSLIRAASLLQKPVTRERSIRHLPLFFSSLTEWRTLPAIAERPLRTAWPEIPQNVKKPRYRVAFFAGCLNDFVYPELGRDLVQVLNRLAVEVLFPPEQNCCGVPALYSGDRETAVVLAEQNVAAMLEQNPDFVVTTCPTCTLALQRDFVDHLRENPVWAARARRLSAITMDVSRFIVEKLDGGNEIFQGRISGEKITYHDSCHLKRGAGIWREPRQLLAASGHEVTEMSHADRCCGFGGSYSFTGQPAVARRIMEDKLTDIKRTAADCVAMDCPGCLMQIRGGLDKKNADVRAAHTIEILAEAIR